ncbi:MAG: PAS domain S-box protein [Gammaproteobacteria bacterium]|nr:PAS domain S-box protein [Gammaproteobacteria bacterium]
MSAEHDTHDSELFRMAVEMAPAGIIAVDAAGIILLVNQEVERLFGYTRDELIGQSVDRLVPERFRASHPAHRDGYLTEPRTRPMGSGRDLYGLRKDGSEVPVEIGLNPVTRHGRVVTLASVVDLSARRRAEARFQAAVESSPSGMLMTDAAGKILLVNREVERLFGYDRSELVGKPIEVLVPERFSQQHPQHRKTFFAEPTSRPMGVGRDLYGLRKDGREIMVEIGLNPIHTDEGVRVLCSIVDITARRQTEEQLRHAQKMEAIGTLASGIAHDFNNVLFSIVGYAELVQDSPVLEEQQRADLAHILQAAERGRQLVQRILAFSRKADVERVPTRLNRTLQEIFELLRATLPATIEIHQNLSASTPQVLSDGTQLHQVVMNLATNAAHAMPEGGVLEFTLGPYTHGDHEEAPGPHLKSGLYARLTVKDSGTGMTREVLDRAREPFFTTKDVTQGTGLGLAIIHGIVDSHDGAMEIHSTVGEGTRIDIYFPAYSGGTPAGANTVEDAVDEGLHVLLVDDEPDLAAMLKRQIAALGYHVTAHTSSLEALAAFRAKPAHFDLLVTDNTMPKMTGLALTKAVLRERPDLPVLLISGLADVTDPQTLMDMGVSKVLPKPHSAGALRSALEQLLPPKPKSPG